MNRRNLVLGAMLAGALALSAWTLLTPQDAVVEPVARPAPGSDSKAIGIAGAAGPNASAAPSPRPAAQPTLAGTTQPAPAAAHNLFSAYSYKPAPPPPVETATVVAHAPPLPFVYGGRLDVEGHTTYLLLRGDAPVRATVGTPIGDFTLVEVSAASMVFVHGPTGERVTMPITTAFN